jgi:hypothetical protein
MSDSIAPVPVTDTCWLYGERKGLTVVQEDRDADGKLRTTLTVTIPWDSVARARGRRPMSRTLSKDQGE